MRIIRDNATEIPTFIPKHTTGVTDECGRTTHTNESYSKFTESRTEKNGWTIIRTYSENYSVYDGEKSFYASHNTTRTKGETSEYINRSYSSSNGIVTVTSSKGHTRTYNECELPFEEWQFEVEFED
jgi:hypothetical protein